MSRRPESAPACTGCRRPTRLDRHAAVLLVAHQHPGLARAQQVGHDRQGNAAPLNLKGPVALAVEDQYVAITVAHQQIDQPRAVAMHLGQAGRLRSDGNAERVAKGPIAVAGKDPDLARVLHQDGQVEVAVAVEVAGHDGAGAVVDAGTVAGRRGERERRVGESARSVGGQDRQAVRALVDGHDVVEPAAREVARDQADSLRERADRRSARGRALTKEARAGAESQRLGERVVRSVQEDGHVAGRLVAHDDVKQSVAGDVSDRDIRRCDAGGHGHRGRERPGRRLEGDRDAVVEGIGGDQVGESVARQVGGCETGWQRRRRERDAARDLTTRADRVDGIRVKTKLAGRQRRVEVGVGGGDGKLRPDGGGS